MNLLLLYLLVGSIITIILFCIEYNENILYTLPMIIGWIILVPLVIVYKMHKKISK